jgi:hypothetical protein
MTDESFRELRQPWVGAGQVEHLVADLTVIMSADATLASVQAKLAENDQWLPIDGPVDATIGTLLNINSTGALRLGFGAWRDLLLGVQFLNGRGELITAGGVPIKNVAGYDLAKFMVGQSGILGEIAAVITRAYRRPKKAVVARFVPEQEILAKLVATPARPTWAMMDTKELLLGYLGDEGETEFYLQSLRDMEADRVETMEVAQEMKFRQSRWRVLGPWDNSPWVFRASVPPARIADFVAAIGEEDWIADAAFGIVLGGADERSASVISGAAAAMGGSVICRSVGDGKLMGTTVNPSEELLLERLKKAFDGENKFAALPRGI